MKHTAVLVFVAAFIVRALAQTCIAAPTTFHVVDPSGNPVVGAKVYVLDSGSDKAPDALVTDSAGAFSVDTGAVVYSQYVRGPSIFMVAAKGLAVTGYSFRNDNTILHLSLPVTLTGSVVDANGNPVVGAAVSAKYAYGQTDPDTGIAPFGFYTFSPLNTQFTEKTDAKGDYSISGLPSNSRIDLQLTDVRYASQDIYTAQGQSVAPVITALPGTSISGKVVGANGKSAAGLKMQFQKADGSNQSSGSDFRTASDGSYTITGLAPGQYSVDVTTEGNDLAVQDWAPPIPLSVTTSVDSPGKAPELVLSVGEDVTGQIVDSATKQPVSKVYVELHDTAGQGQVIRTAVGITGPDGRYKVRSWSGSVDLVIVGAPSGYAVNRSQQSPVLTVVDGHPLTVDPIIIERELVVTGKVVRKDGKAPGVVSLNVQEVGTNGTVYGGQVVRTAADGTYKIPGLGPGSYSIFTPPNGLGQGLAAPPPVSFELADGKPTVLPNLILVPGTLVTGTVVDAGTKKPIPGVIVGLHDNYATGIESRSATATTDADGKYSIEAWAGSLEFDVYGVPAEYANVASQTNRRITVVDGQPQTLDPIGIGKALTMKGIAVDDKGAPAPGVQLQIQRTTNDGEWVNIQPVTTAADGSFTFKQLLPGAYTVDAGTEWTVVSPAALTEPLTGPVQLSLKRTITTELQGTAVDTTGAPLSGVNIAFMVSHKIANGNTSQTSVTATTDSTGFFTLSGMPFDPQLIQMQNSLKDGYVYKNGGDITSAGNKLSISLIVLAKLGGAISGIVRNGLGAPVDDAAVACPTGVGDPRPFLTDASGKFKFTNLAMGQVEIYAGKGKYYGHITAQATDKESDVTVDLTPLPDPAQPGNIDLGYKMLNQLDTDSQGWHMSSMQWMLRDQSTTLLANCSADVALKFLLEFNKLTCGDLDCILWPQSKINPVAASIWGIPEILKAADAGYTGRDSSELGLMVAPYDQGMANQLYDIAAKTIRLDVIYHGNPWQDWLDYAMNLVALAYAVHKPNADDMYKQLLTDIEAEKTVPNGKYSTWTMSELATTMAQGNLDLALKIVAALPPGQQSSAKIRIIGELIRPNPAEALTVFHSIDKTNDMSTYTSALFQVLPTIFKTDPKGALAASEALGDPHDRAEGITIVADRLPLEQARPLYKDAEATSVENGQGTTPVSIAAHAYLRDPTLGAQLFKQAYETVINGTSTQNPSFARFAFYYSRLDPGYCRVLLENEFQVDQTIAQQYNQSPLQDVAAMSAIDIDRAEAMADSIKSPDTRFSARSIVAGRVMQDQHTRDTMPFSSWGGWGGWSPGDFTPW